MAVFVYSYMCMMSCSTVLFQTMQNRVIFKKVVSLITYDLLSVHCPQIFAVRNEKLFFYFFSGWCFAFKFETFCVSLCLYRHSN